jgi:hypothetical protein
LAIPRSMGWLVVTGVVVAALVALSVFALDRPDVVWADGRAHCPHCRTPAQAYAQRCAACREEFDWASSPDEQSPACRHCLSPAQDEWVRDRRRALGDDKAAAAVAARTDLQITQPAAAEYLKVASRGQCGWCGGTGSELSGTAGDKCPVCFGERRCTGCGGDRLVALGVEAARVEKDRLVRLEGVLFAARTPAARARSEMRDAQAEFLRRHAGTFEAESLVFWPSMPYAGTRVTALDRARGRVAEVLAALAE